MTLQVVDKKHGISRREYPNGFDLNLIDYPRRRRYLAKLGIGVGVGNEGLYPHGTNHLYEHILVGPYMQSIPGTSNLNAETKRAITTFWASCKPDALELVVKRMFSSVEQYKDGLDRHSIELGRITNETRMNRDRIDEWAEDSVFLPALFKGTALERSECASIASYRKITPEQLLEYHDRWCTAPNLSLCVAGPIGNHADEIEEVVARTFGSLPATNFEHPTIDVPIETPNVVVSRRRACHRENWALGWRVLGNSTDVMPLSVLDSYLSNTSGGRLFDAINSSGVRSYDPKSFYVNFRHCAAFYVMMGVDPGQFDQSFDVVRRTLDGVKHDFTDAQLSEAIDAAENEYQDDLEDPERSTDFIVRGKFDDSIISRPADFYGALEGVTADDVLRVANKYFDFDKVTVARVMPFKKVEQALQTEAHD